MRYQHHFTDDEVRLALREAIWEHEREPRTSIWYSFWDRLLDGEEAPDLPKQDAS